MKTKTLLTTHKNHLIQAVLAFKKKAHESALSQSLKASTHGEKTEFLRTIKRVSKQGKTLVVLPSPRSDTNTPTN
jgi:hypothetical protein